MDHSAAPRWILVSGCLVMALAVALGAFGAHGLKAHTDAYGLATWETAVRYQAWHGLGLLILTAANQYFPRKTSKAAALCMLTGIAIFSGSLYVLVLSGIKWLGAITPIGGVLLIVAWLVLAVGAENQKTNPDPEKP